MPKQSLTIKQKLICGVVSGLIFALIMSGLDQYQEKGFSVASFLLRFFLFGIVMGLIARPKKS